MINTLCQIRDYQTITGPAYPAGIGGCNGRQIGRAGDTHECVRHLNCHLQNTGLHHSPFHPPGYAVNHLGGVQAQDFAAAKWALRHRV